MIDILRFRLRYGRQTIAFPKRPPSFPERFRGRPAIDTAGCNINCTSCTDVCPTGAVLDAGGLSMRIDLGRCTFCGDCATSCQPRSIRFTQDHRLASSAREALAAHDDVPIPTRPLPPDLRRTFGRSLKLRQVSAAGCNGCEAELGASGNIQFDAGRFGIQFVASPRHADGIVVTGPVSENMRVALLKTWEAVPPPRIVIAVGACAISGGAFRSSPSVHDGAENALGGVPVDLYVPGCPPHPITFLDGVLRLLGRIR